jgi:hypothetical protein
MKMNLANTKNVAGFLLVLFLITSCEDPERPHKPVDTLSLLDNTPRENNEAESAALWLSGNLVAPEHLYMDLLYGLQFIHDEFSGIPELENIDFIPPWVPGELSLQLSEGAIRELRMGEYRDLDSLNTCYRLSEMDTTLLWFIPWVHLRFEGRLNPKKLTEYYRVVESVEYVEPNNITAWGSDIYPWRIPGGISYLIRYSHDCGGSVWCKYHRFSYFKVHKKAFMDRTNKIEYLGSFIQDVDPLPHWWDEAKAGYDAKRNE